MINDKADNFQYINQKAAAESQELIRLRWQKAMLERAIAEKKKLKEVEMMK